MAVAAAFAFAGQESSEHLTERVLAEVNGVPVTQRDVQEALLLDDQWQQALRQGNSVEARDMREQIRNRVLNELIDEHLLVQAAHRRGLRLDEEAKVKVEIQLEAWAKQYWGSLAAFNDYLSARGLALARLRERRRQQVLIRSLEEREMVASDAFVRPSEIRNYYEQHRERYRKPGRVVFFHLLLSKRRGLEQARALAQQCDERLTAGRDWLALCKENSDGARPQEGGRMEVAAVEDIGSSALREAVAALAIGDRSGVVETDRSFLIVKLAERTEPGFQLFADVQDEIHDLLSAEHRERFRIRLKKKVRERAIVHLRKK